LLENGSSISSARHGAAAAGWPHIWRGKPLSSRRYRSGKTLAAFLACIDRLVRKALAGELVDQSEVLYVSPLKRWETISSGTWKLRWRNPATGGSARTPHAGDPRAVRTGDTLMHERRACFGARHTSLLRRRSRSTSADGRKEPRNLKTVETVIVDEIHAVADDKRGSHLALSLERLEALTNRPIRIGLRTQNPIELIARFLAEQPAGPVIVHIENPRQLDIAVEVPPASWAHCIERDVGRDLPAYRRTGAQHRSTLVFVNTRRLAERVATTWANVWAKMRLPRTMEASLASCALRRKEAQGRRVRVLVPRHRWNWDRHRTVDLVCQIGSPRSIAVGLQRVGRAATGVAPSQRPHLRHYPGRVAGMRRAGARHSLRDLDRIAIPEAPWIFWRNSGRDVRGRGLEGR